MKDGTRRPSRLTVEVEYEPDPVCEVRAVMIALGTPAEDVIRRSAAIKARLAPMADHADAQDFTDERAASAA